MSGSQLQLDSEVEVKPHCPMCGMEQPMNVPNPVDEYITHVANCYDE